MSELQTTGLLVLAVISIAAAGGDEPRLKVTTRRADDRVDVKVERDKTIFSIHSPIGISHAVLRRTGEAWPDAVVVRLHLKGLENFRLTNGKVKIEGSASIQAGKARVRLWKVGTEDTPLDAKSPYWTEVRILDGDGRSAKEIPLEGGHFELALPKALFDGNPAAVTVDWIDFYRN